jgi:TolB-like protein/AraC-like DNA-binding protein
MEHPFIDKIKQIILDHLDDEKFDVSKLSSEIGMSKSQTFRKVKFLANKSVNQFIRETRLQEAAKLILNSNLHASEISYKVGFSSPTYFNKCFSKYYGITPGRYKERSKENSQKKIVLDQQSLQSGIKKFQIVLYILGTALLLFGIISIVKSKMNPPEISIAVLYFEDYSPESDMQWFCDGVTEEIITKLSGIKRLEVTSRTSAKQFRNSDQSSPEIAKVLGVDYIIEGSVRKGNDSIRITAQLINSNDKHNWSINYNESLDNSIKIQGEFSKLIAQQLKIDLSPEEIQSIEKVSTDNLDAYNLYLKAEYQKNLLNKIAFDKAFQLYEQVIALDSNFVEAYIGLSEIWQFRGIIWGLYNEQEAWGKSKELLLKASNIDQNNNRLEYNLHFGYFYYEWDFESMEKYYQKRLIKSNYDFLTGLIQDYAIKTGRYNEALLLNERNIINSPNISYLYTYKAGILMLLGKKDEAIEILANYDTLYSDDMFYLRDSGHLYFYLEEYGMSKNQLRKIRINFPNENLPSLIWLDAIFSRMDYKKEDAALYLDQLVKLYDTNNSGSPAWFIALYYCYFKDYENTFVWLQKSYDRHEVEMTRLRSEPILIPLRDDVRYIDLYHKIGFSKID